MANQEHLDLLKKNVIIWNNRRMVYNKVRPDLISANLRSANLRSANLGSANLNSANLGSANLNSANLHSANLDSANLHSANLHSANLCKANLCKANLDSADLNSAKLISADLHHADLIFADLHRADLIFADLRDANLRSANLHKANLNSANLRSTNLRSAKLWYANLRDANLQNVDLRYADLHGAIMGNTTIDNIDLGSVKNLDTVVHIEPSVITTRTFIKSKGLIPQEFLKGVGLSDWEIESVKLYQPNLSPDQITSIVYKIDELRNTNPIQFYPVFLSHSWKDKKITRKLYDALQRKGVRCWMDEKQMKMGEKLIKGINKGISLYDKMVLVCSKDSLTSWWVEEELKLIFNKERQINEGKNEKDRYDLLIPIDLDGYIFDGWDGSWQTKMKSQVIGDFRGCMKDEKKFNQKVEELVAALRVNPPDVAPQSFLPKPK